MTIHKNFEAASIKRFLISGEIKNLFRSFLRKDGTPDKRAAISERISPLKALFALCQHPVEERHRVTVPAGILQTAPIEQPEVRRSPGRVVIAGKVRALAGLPQASLPQRGPAP